MGKKLRNREVLTETDYQNDDDVDNQCPITQRISKSNLRNKLKSQYNKKRKSHQKQNKFHQRLASHQLNDILKAQSFECPICLELVVCPMMMACGHIYCRKCLESNTAYTQKCCLCRQEQDHQPSIPLKIVEILIEKFILPSTQEIINYLCRTTDSAQWLRRRKLNHFKQGLIIDFQDRWGKWRRGVIAKNISNEEIQVKAVFNGVQIFQKISRSSSRIAPFTFFTRGRYLQDFPSTLPEYDPTHNSLHNLQYRATPISSELLQIQEQPQYPQNNMEYSQGNEDEMLQLFNLQMRQNEFIFNID